MSTSRRSPTSRASAQDRVGQPVRSYVFMPYTLAKDHRTGFENGNIQAVMDGDIDGFINAYLSMNADKETK